jgi:hypothetical protein
MAPIEEPDTKATAQQTTAPAKSKKTGKKKPGQSRPQTDNVVPFTEVFTPTTEQQPEQDFAPVTRDWFDQPTEQTEQQQQAMTDPHRSLLQAMMGWDDVPYGKKWNHYLQHGLVGVSRENVDNITKMAALEGRNGSLSCRELLSMKGVDASSGGAPEERTEEYYKRRPCPEYVRIAAEETAKRLAGVTVRIKASSGADGRLYGAVTAKEIASELAASAGITVDKRKIQLDAPIKAHGSYRIEVRLFEDVSGTFTVSVEA